VSDQAADAMDARTVLPAWGFAGYDFSALSGGLINTTYKVEREGQPIAVLQKLHPVFGAEVNVDIDAVTTHLAANGMATPRLLRTSGGHAWVTQRGRTWRMLSWVPGEAVAKVPNPAWAQEGGALVGRFHRTMSNFAYDYQFTRAGVHDTVDHLQKLRAALDGFDTTGLTAAETATCDQARQLSHQILAAVDLSFDMAAMPLRHCHGDLKISNLLFEVTDAPRGRCLVDLDTVGRGNLAFELGDAMRSWCNPHAEDAGLVEFDLQIFQAAMTGYFAQCDGHSETERASIVHGLHRVCVELAARFCVDVFANNYFGWDRTRFDNRRSHNLVRAQGQLALAAAVQQQMSAALDIVTKLP
jgi:Ser/Thr protein kinase RdoA (MazF antagonist)